MTMRGRNRQAETSAVGSDVFEMGVEMREAMRIHEINRGRQMRVNEGNGSLRRFFARVDLLAQPFEQILR